MKFLGIYSEALRLTTKEFRCGITSIKIRIEIRRFNVLGNLFHLEGKRVKLINFLAKSRSRNDSSCLASRESMPRLWWKSTVLYRYQHEPAHTIWVRFVEQSFQIKEVRKI
jgi:hypothetical protein